MKQTPKQWYEKFDNIMISNGFLINGCDKCVYLKKFREACVLVCLCIDDMLTNIEVISKTKIMFTNNFDRKDMSETYFILRMKIYRALDRITLSQTLSQTYYVDNIFERFKIHSINDSNNTFPLM